MFSSLGYSITLCRRISQRTRQEGKKITMPIPLNPPVVNPCFLSYNPRCSGDLKTGEIQHVRGGGRCASLYSGALFSGTTQPAAGTNLVQLSNAGEMLFWSGAGRLNSVTVLAMMQSGQAVVFYDSAVLTSGGPFAASGHKILGRIPQTLEPASSFLGASGTFTSFLTSQPFYFDCPFTSGLCMNTRSGAPGITIQWTPEVSNAFAPAI